jgi:hypothetical protein
MMPPCAPTPTLYTVKKKLRVTHAHNMRVTDNALRSSGMIYVDDGGFFRLFYVDGGLFHRPYVVGLRHANSVPTVLRNNCLNAINEAR